MELPAGLAKAGGMTAVWLSRPVRRFDGIAVGEGPFLSKG